MLIDHDNNGIVDIVTDDTPGTGGIGKAVSSFFWLIFILFELAVAAVLTAVVFTGIPEKLAADYFINDDISKVPQYVYFPVSDAKHTNTFYTEEDNIPLALPCISKEPVILYDDFGEVTIKHREPGLHYEIEIDSPGYADCRYWHDVFHTKPDIDTENFFDDPLEAADPYQLLLCTLTQHGFDSFARSKGLPPIDSYFDLSYTIYNTTMDDQSFWGAEKAKTFLMFAYLKEDTDIPDYYFENEYAKGFVENNGERIDEGYYKYYCRAHVYSNDNEDFEYGFRIRTDDQATLFAVLNGIGQTELMSQFNKP